MSMTQTYQTIGEFTVEKREYEFTNGPTYFVRLTGSDEAITSKYCKTERAVLKLVEKARAIVARKAAQKAATAVRHAAKDAAKGVVRDECQICCGGWVIENGRTSLHGYTRPGHGWLVGSCMGARELPFSKSCEVLKVYRTAVANWRGRVGESLVNHKAGRVTKLTRYENKPGTFGKETRPVEYVKGRPVDNFANFRSFDDALISAIHSLESDVRNADDELKRVDERVALWQSKFGK